MFACSVGYALLWQKAPHQQQAKLRYDTSMHACIFPIYWKYVTGCESCTRKDDDVFNMQEESTSTNDCIFITRYMVVRVAWRRGAEKTSM